MVRGCITTEAKSALEGDTVLVMVTDRQARFLRSMLGVMSPNDFAQDNHVMNFVRSKFPDCIDLNNAIAGPLIELLGSGMAGHER